MGIVEKKTEKNFRTGGHPLGLHRVLNPSGAFPQGAEQLDTTLPLYDTELLIDVERINLDSASFFQIREDCLGDPQKISERIMEITRSRGKMENPVTGSGGMLIGRVAQIGDKSPLGFKVGDRIATLVSLTLTPLVLEKIDSVNLQGGQVQAQGHAILFEKSVAAPLPGDMPEKVALAILDVCGAPAWVRKKVRPGEKVLVLGTGKAGLLSVLALMDTLPRELIWLSDVREESVEEFLERGWGGQGFAANARDPKGFQDQLAAKSAPLFDFVVNTCNVPETEMAALLACKPGGKILFFNMATDFSRAVLSAEGMGLEVEMIMGNGYAEGHWQYALDLARRNPEVLEWFRNMES